MDNNELDRILKEKLKNKIKPSAEIEGKIRQKVEQEKMNQLKLMNTENNNNKNKNKKYKIMKSIVSMVAVILIVFAVGVNLDKVPNVFETETVTVANIKGIEPTKTLNGILASDSDFIIYADDTNAESVQKSLYVEPALEYTIKKESDNSYRLKFKQNIPDNTIVKLQYVKNKITEDSWAYQTSNKLSISSTYPYNNETGVSKNTTIDINFSYANIENLKSNVEISPAVEGKWEHLGKTWRFTPKKELKDTQKYIIKINKGIKAEEEILEEDYVFSFTVNTGAHDTKYTRNITTIDGIENCKSNELVKIHYNTDEYYNTSKEEISKIEISKFKTADEFIEYVKTNNYKNTESLGEYKFTRTEYYLQLTKTLQTGYYVASIKDQNNNEIFNCPVQINDLSAYAMQTERDIIAWVAEDNDLAKNIKVEYLGKEEKTNSQGIAEFKGILDGTETVKYLKIGNNENKLVVGIYNYEHTNYPSCYIYTDRPLYKNTDTINVWGFVPRQLFYDKIDEESFYIELNDEEKYKIKIDENGSFNYKIELKNHTDIEYSYITLYYKGEQIASREVTIENYELQNYTYNVIMDRNYGYAGENFEFEVKVEHITGLNVPNKSVVIEYNDKTYRKTTDENGVAKFSVKLKKSDDESTSPNYDEISIYNGDAQEYTDSEEYISIYVLNRNTYTNIEYKEDKKYELTLYKLAKDTKATVSYDLHEIYEGKYDTDVKVRLIEEVRERTIDGYTYNEYTKENEPDYTYELTATNPTYIETISTKDGKIEFDASELNLKEDTEETHYSYEIEFTYKDGNNKQVKEKSYIYFGDEYKSNSLGYTYYPDMYGCGLGNVPTEIDYEDYATYRYLLTKNVDEFSIGDTVNLSLAESTENEIKDITNEGKILRIVFKEDISKKDIIEDNNISYTFTDEDFPGCGIASAYFINGKFYRMPTYYFDFNEEDRETKVEITADKNEYKPGDKVTLTVKTTNDGKPIKSVVNISVINKAVFELREDRTDILNSIYQDKFYNVYTYSTYKDYLKGEGGGGGGRKWRNKRKLRRYRML